MSDKPTEAEIDGIIRSIAEPSFRYISRRIDRMLISNQKIHPMNPIDMTTIMTASMSVIDANMIRTIQGIYKLATGKEVNVAKLHELFSESLKRQLKIGMN